MPLIPLIQQIIVLFLMMGMGYLIVKLGLLKAEDSRVVSALCVYLIMPCVIINAFQISFTAEILRGFFAAVAIAVGMHLLLFLLAYGLGRGVGMTPVEQLSVIYPNAGNLVIPLVTALFGAEWVIYASAFMSVQLCCLWTHAQSVMSGELSFSPRKILTNVNLLAIFIGLGLFLGGISLPGVIRTTLSSVSSGFGPLCMIMIGMMLAGTPLAGIVRNRRIYVVAAFRLLAVPVLGIILLKLVSHFLVLPNKENILTIVLLAMITPASATVTQLSQIYNRESEYCSAINVMTTLLCIFTMPLMMWLWTAF